jgi:LmbE family N-acetylglucosaminyl deacetylase
MPRRRRLYWLVLAVLLVLLGEAGRRLALSHSLYELNRHSEPPLELMQEPRAGERILIFAPHPDDETLSCAGLIQRALLTKAQVHIALMTNGEYPELSVVLFEEALRPSSAAFVRLGYRRQHETLKAMEYLGLPESAVTFLGYPNNYLNQMWLPDHWSREYPVRSVRTRTTRSPYTNTFSRSTPYAGECALADIKALLQRLQPDAVITLHPNDIHVDHWPTYAFLRYALEELTLEGQSFAARCRTYSYLIHRPHWPTPRRYRPWLTLEPPTRLASGSETRWLAFPLTLGQTIDKRKAILYYRTQGGGIDPLLTSFARANELFGEVAIHSWPGRRFVAPEVVINDPIADTDTAARYPRADLRMVTMSRANRHLIVDLITRRKPSRTYGYHLSIHFGGTTDKSRVAAAYDWQGDSLRGVLFRDGKLTAVPQEACQVTYTSTGVALIAPWPAVDDGPGFFMIRAWSTRGKRVVDQTTVATYRITQP